MLRGFNAWPGKVCQPDKARSYPDRQPADPVARWRWFVALDGVTQVQGVLVAATAGQNYGIELIGVPLGVAAAWLCMLVPTTPGFGTMRKCGVPATR